MTADRPAVAQPGRSGAEAVTRAVWRALNGPPPFLDGVEYAGVGDLPGAFAVSDLATGSIAVAALALAEFVAARHGARPAVRVDRRLAALWFERTLRPAGWQTPPAWDAVAGDYATADGWIRLHTNAPHHRAAALAVLGVPGAREQVARAVAGWPGEALEGAVADAGGVAGFMRSTAAWADHPQGRAVAVEPLVSRAATGSGPAPAWPGSRARPLHGVRVLDLTRILAGPVATRFLAGYGASVVRVDPPGWEEPANEPEMTLGKHCCRLDLRDRADRSVFAGLLRGADVLVHGYRSDALERLGFGADWRRASRPGLIEVALDAFGWTGPWRARRGFDSIVQMTTGIAHTGMVVMGRDRPTPLPVQALDHATGYLLAAAALRGMTERLQTGQGSIARASLARTGAFLQSREHRPGGPAVAPEGSGDLAPARETTAWGPARRLRPAYSVAGTPAHWDVPAGPLGSAPAAWPRLR